MGIVEDKNKKQSCFVHLPFAVAGLEQSMPANAVLAKEGAEEFLQDIDPAVMPLGIITFEDILEELIGEEIYDEFDLEDSQASYVPPEIHHQHQNHVHGVNLNPSILRKKESAPQILPTNTIEHVADTAKYTQTLAADASGNSNTATAQSSGIDPEHDTPANATKEEVVDFKNVNVLLTNMVNFAK